MGGGGGIGINRAGIGDRSSGGAARKRELAYALQRRATATSNCVPDVTALALALIVPSLSTVAVANVPAMAAWPTPCATATASPETTPPKLLVTLALAFALMVPAIRD